MKIVDGVLKVNMTDLDHILQEAYPYEDSEPPSILFKQGIDDELRLSGLEDQEFNKLEITLDWEAWLSEQQ